MTDSAVQPDRSLAKLLGKRVRFKFEGGREVEGDLAGADRLVNAVLKNTVEYLRDPLDSEVLTGETRKLGTLVVRGNAVVAVFPVENYEETENPF